MFTDTEDDFFSGNEQTPLREDAFALNPKEKQDKIEKLFAQSKTKGRPALIIKRINKKNEKL
jgi:hypothetical protein